VSIALGIFYPPLGANGSKAPPLGEKTPRRRFGPVIKKEFVLFVVLFLCILFFSDKEIRNKRCVLKSDHFPLGGPGAKDEKGGALWSHLFFRGHATPNTWPRTTVLKIENEMPHWATSHGCMESALEPGVPLVHSEQTGKGKWEYFQTHRRPLVLKGVEAKNDAPKPRRPPDQGCRRQHAVCKRGGNITRCGVVPKVAIFPPPTRFFPDPSLAPPWVNSDRMEKFPTLPESRCTPDVCGPNFVCHSGQYQPSPKRHPPGTPIPRSPHKPSEVCAIKEGDCL